MPQPLPLPPVVRHGRSSRRTGGANPLYGYNYNPAWPSILSVAHDEFNGAIVYVITDRPCVLNAGLPPLAIAGRTVSSASMVLPVKCRVTFNGAIARGAAWSWPAGDSHIVDPVTSHGLNASAGNCADSPGPFPPAVPVTGTSESGTSCVLIFGGPVTLIGSPVPDDAITFNGLNPVNISQFAADTILFTTAAPLSAGSTWLIKRQPAWITQAVVWPENGVFS